MKVKSTAVTRVRQWLGGIALLLAALAVLPQAAHAWPTKYTSCSSCHTGTEPTATVSAALNGAAGTTISVAAGTTFEIDWIVRNISGSGRMGMELAVPTGWTVATGTANAPALAGWNNVWNATDGEFWWATSYSTATQFPSSPVGYTINFDGPNWDSGTRNAAMDDAAAMDLDATANTMGTDARVTVPGGTPNGTYTIQLTGVGHAAGGGAKSYVTQAITVTVSGGDSTAPVPGTVNVSPQSATYVPAAFTITTSFTDAESAVSTCQYTLNGVAWSAGVVSGAGPYTCTANVSGQANGAGLSINMRATSAGGTGTATQLTRTVDAAAPTTTNNAPAGWQSADVAVTLTPTDAGSGVATTQYCIDATNTCTPATTGTIANVTQTAGTAGTQYVRYRSTDNLSNVEATQSATVQIDKALPTDGSLSASPSNSQVGLSWTVAADVGSGLRGTNTYDLRFLTGATPPTCATGTSIYLGTGTSHTHTGLTNGTQYSYRLCAYDAANNASTGATASATPSAVCSAANPTVTIVAPNKQITVASGSVVYTVEVTNNDSIDCASTTFSLSRADSNATSFAASVLGTNSLLVAPGATQTTTLTVTATGSPTNGVTNNSTVSTAAAGPHGAVTSPAITTLINLSRTATMNFNVGETIHFEFRSSTRFASAGAGALSLYSSTGAIIQANLNMLETQVGTTWVYTYDWNTTAQAADAYRIKIWDGSDTIPAANGMVVLGNSTKKLNLYADAGYTTPTDIFAQGATVYAEVLLPSAETGTMQVDVSNWYDAVPTNPAVTTTETGTRYRFNFVVDFAGASINNGDWGWFYWLGQATGIEFHRPIQRNDAGCGSCTRSTPTVAMVTANQTITSEAGSVDYTINVTNNDTVSCGPTSFDLSAVDSNAANFNPTAFGSDPLAVGPGLTGATVMTVSAKAAQPNGSTNNTYFYTAADGNHAASANSASRTTTISVADVTAPVVTAFAVPATSISWSIPVTTFTATDAVGVTGYKITESATPPLAGDAGWTASAPATYLTASDSAAKVLYAWAKDAAGNVSASLTDTVNVDATAPVVSDFTMPATSTSLTVPITQFLASDAIGVTGYKVTTSATAPLAGDAGWTASAPASYTVASSNTYTFYPWAKDALGNVSALFASPRTVTVDTVAPTVSSTVPANAATGVALNADFVINFSEAVDCGTVTTANIVSDNPTWTYDGTSCLTSSGLQAIFNVTGQAYATTYNVSITAGVRDLVGNSLSPAPRNVAYTTTAEPCVRNAPTVAILTANQNALVDGDLVNYTVSVTNNDTGACGNTTFNLVAVDSNAISFDPSTFDVANVSLAPSASGTRSLRVTAKMGALNGASNDTYFYTTDVSHAQSANSSVASTVIAVPCDIAPDVAINTASQSITTNGGSAAYTIQVTNNNALACGTTAFDLVVVDDNGVAFNIPSTFTADPLSVAPGGASNTTTMTVSSIAGAANFSANNTYFYTALVGTIPRSANSNAVTTTLNRPCVRNAPGFSAGVNKTIPLDGSAVYNLTIVNNDVDCAATTFNLALVSETGNTAAFTLPSTFSAPSVSVASGATNGTVTFTVVGNGTGADGNTLTSTVRVSSASHAAVDTVPVTSLKNFSPLIHNSFSTGSSKHVPSGGWGVAGGKYGEFSCNTCHTKTTGNVKRIVGSLPNAPDTSKGNFPGAGVAVVFQDVRDATSQFGDDTTAHATSNRICEVCHTYDPTDPRDDGVKQHAFNMPVPATHYNKADCITCHKHSDGFKAGGGSCDSCHGYPPTASDGKSYLATEGKGAHLKHVNHLAAKAGITLSPTGDSFGDTNTTLVCGVCHDMSAASHQMSGGTRSINFNGATTFQLGSSAPLYNGTQGQSSSVDPKTCSNLNCHFQATPWWE